MRLACRTGVFFVEAAFWLFALCHVRDGGAWHAVLWTQVFAGMVWTLNRIAEETLTTPSVAAIGLAGLVLIYAVATDRHHPTTRDWLHWLGVGILAADLAESSLWLFAAWLGITAAS